MIRPLILALAGLAALLPSATAQSPVTYTWTGSASGVWSEQENWLGGIIPVLPNDYNTELSFAVPAGFTSTRNDLNGELRLNRLVFSSSGSTALTLGRANTDLTSVLAFGGANAAIVQNGNGEISFALTPTSTSATTATALPMRLDADVTVTGPGLGNINLDSPILGTGRLIIAGGAPTFDTRVVSIGPSTTAGAVLNAFGGVILDGGNLEIGSTRVDALGGAVGSLNTLQVTANGGYLAVGSSTTAPGLLTNIDITAGATLRLGGASDFTLDPAATLSGAGNLLLQNTGIDSLTISSNSSSFTGRITFDTPVVPSDTTGTLGLLVLEGANGALRGVTEFAFRAGSGLELDSSQTSGINSDRILDTATIQLSGGTLALTGGANTAVTERIGAISASGYNIITVLTGGSTSTTTPTARDTLLSTPSLTRVDRGTFIVRGTNFGLAPTGGSGSGTTARFVPDTSLAGDLRGGGGGAGTSTISIIPYAIGSTTTSTTAASTTYTFVTYTAANGFRPLSTATTTGSVEYDALTGTSTGATTNFRTSATTAVAITGASAMNSLFISTSPTGGITGPGTITLNSGALLITTITATTIAPSIVFPAGVEGHMFVTSSTGSLTLSGTLTGNTGLTKSGDGVLTLSAAGNSTLTGPLTINTGRVAFTSAAALPGTGDITVYGKEAPASASTGAGIRNMATAAPVDITRNFIVPTGMFMVSAGTSTTVPSTQLTLSGVISGAGGLSVFTFGDVVLSGANTYTGPTLIDNGTTIISSDANLGNGGAVYLAAGSSTAVGGLRLAGNWTTSRHIEVTTSRIDTNGFNAVWNGPITGTLTLAKSGAGRLTITSSSPFDGIVTLVENGGEFRLTGNGSLSTSTYNLPLGSTLAIDQTSLPAGTPAGNTPVTTDRISDGANIAFTGTVAGASGTLLVLGNSTRSVSERIGRITAPTTAGVQGLVFVDTPANVLTVLRIGDYINSGLVGSVLFRGQNLGTATGTATQVFIDKLNGVDLTGTQLLPNTFIESITAGGTLTGAAVYDPVVGVRLTVPEDFTTGREIRNPINGGTTPLTTNFEIQIGAGQPARPPDTFTVGAENTVSSIKLNGGTVLSLASGTLFLSSGNIVADVGTASQITGGILAAGGGNGTLTSRLAFATNGNLNVDSILQGTNGLSKVGTGTLTLSGANTFTGAITITAGTLALTSTASLVGGTTPNNLTVSNGTAFTANGATVNLGTFTINSGGTATFTNATVRSTTLSGTASTTTTPAYPVLNLNGTTVLTVDGTTSSTFSGLIAGTGSIVKRGTSTLTLSITDTNSPTGNTFSGGVTIEGGTVSASTSLNRLGTGPLVLNGGTLSYSGTAMAPANLTIGAAGGTLSPSSTTAGTGLILPATFNWNGTLGKAGSGTLFASASYTTTQTLNATAGIFDLGTFDLTVGNFTGNGGTVQLNGGTFTPNTNTFGGNVAGTGTLVLPAATTTFTPTGTTQTIDPALGGNLGIFYNPLSTTGASASGTLTLGGNNTFTGGVTGSPNAKFLLKNPNALGTGPVVLTNDVPATALAFTFGTGVSGTIANAITLSSFGGIATTFDNNSSTSTLTFTGAITGGGASNQFVQTVLRLTGSSSTASTLNVFALTNPANTFQAIVEIDIGALAIAADTFGNPANPIRLATGTTASTSRGGLRFDADFPAAAPFARTIIVRDSNFIDTQAFNVVLSGPVTDSSIPPTVPGGNPTVTTGTLTKVGTGTLTLANAGNTHTGLIIVSQGTLSVTGTVAAGGTTTANFVTVNAGGTLLGTGTINRPINLNEGGTLQGGVGLASGTLTAGGITLDGANTVRVVVGGTPAAPSFSQLNFGSGAIAINAGGTAVDLTTIRLVDDGTLVPFTTYTVTIATYGSISGTPLPSNFTVVSDNFLMDPGWTLAVNPTNAILTFSPVPEPASLVALGVVALGIAGLRRRRGLRVGSANG